MNAASLHRRPGARRSLVVVAAAAMFASVFVARLVLPRPEDAIALFYTVPIAFLAASFGLRGGLAGTAAGISLVALWIRITHADITLIGYLSRGTAFLLVGGLVGRLVDVARRTRQESEQFFDLSRDLFCIADTNGYFVRVNGSWERLLGWSTDELVSRPYTDFVHPDDLAATEREAAGLADGESTVSFTNRYRARDGSWHWIEWGSRLDRETGRILAAARDVSERRALDDQLRELANADSLTGLLNRRRFEEELASALALARRYGARPGVLLIDVDRFKEINDTYGHPAGDAVLQHVAEVLRRCTRETDRIARLGGDEFAVLLPDARLEDAEYVAAKLGEESSATRTELGRVAIAATLSIGVTVADEEVTTTAETLVAAADAALYRAKRGGRARWSSIELDKTVAA